MTVIHPAPSHGRPPGRKTPLRHKLMLLAAFEIMVVGFSLAAFFPVRRPGIVVETTVTPNHVVT